MKFKIENVKCSGCVNMIKNALKDKFGDIEIDIENKILDIDLNGNSVELLKSELEELGFFIKLENISDDQGI